HRHLPLSPTRRPSALFASALDVTGRRAPFGDQADYRMRTGLVVLGAVRALQPGQVAGDIDHCRLHPIADAEVRNPVLARMARGRDRKSTRLNSSHVKI